MNDLKITYPPANNFLCPPIAFRPHQAKLLDTFFSSTKVPQIIENQSKKKPNSEPLDFLIFEPKFFLKGN